MFVEFFAGETLVGFSAADERLNIPAGGPGIEDFVGLSRTRCCNARC